MSLTLTPNIEDPDGFYELLTEAQRDMTADEADDMNARLVLILANQVGNASVLRKAVELAQ